MSKSDTPSPTSASHEVDNYLSEDDRELEALGYVPSFKREFSNLATVRIFPAVLPADRILMQLVSP